MNFQNIPRDDKTIRKLIVPKKDVLSFWDYSNLELRVLAYYMDVSLLDRSLSNEFSRGVDVHAVTAEKLFGDNMITGNSYDKVHYRDIAKKLLFSIVYGGGVRTVAAQLNCDPLEAKNLINDFKNSRPGVSELAAKASDHFSKRGYLRTLAGRHVVPKSAYAALNALIQGSAADIVRHAILLLSHHDLVLCIHDELIFDQTLVDYNESKKEIQECMETLPNIKSYWVGAQDLITRFPAYVQLKVVNTVVSTNWGDK